MGREAERRCAVSEDLRRHEAAIAAREAAFDPVYAKDMAEGQLRGSADLFTDAAFEYDLDLAREMITALHNWQRAKQRENVGSRTAADHILIGLFNDRLDLLAQAAADGEIEL